MARKKTVAKAAEVVEEVKVAETASAEVTPVEAASAEKASPKKSGRKPAAKKTEAEKKPAAAKAATKANLFIQFKGAEVSYADLIEKAKIETGIKSPKSVNLYVKPEDNMVYYIVDDKDGGFVLA